jgi:nitronate monooxygenase
MLTTATSAELVYSSRPSGTPANWLAASLRRKGLDPDNIPLSAGPRNYDHLPADCRPWRDLWSAGQGVDLIDDVPTVAELVSRLRREYVAACRTPDMAEAAGWIATPC